MHFVLKPKAAMSFKNLNNIQKRTVIFSLAMCVAVLAMCLAPTVAYADFTDRADDVDFSSFEDYIKTLEKEQQDALNFTSVKELVKKLLSGESDDFFSGFYSAFSNAALNYFFSFLPSFLAIVTISVFTAILTQAVSGFKKKETEEVVRFVTFAAISTILLVIISNIATMCVTLLGNLGKISAFLFPPLLTIVSGLGGHATVATLQPMMAVMSSGIIALINSLILPLFLSTTVLSIVGNLSSRVSLDKLSGSFKTFGTFVIGGVFSLFITFITFQGITTSAFDSISFNASKYMVSSYVPILGGYVSEGFDLAVAGVVLLKNSIGYVGMLLLLATILFPLVKVLIFVLCLKFCSAVVEPIGEKRIANMLSQLSKNSMLLVTAIIGVTFMFLVLIMLVITSCNMGVI